ncbi:hypothetical protein FXB78_08815 [Aggregatibacter actinomycetemcomitans]|nr:hypothetical protein FXN58_08780 [Aggregatibacter actinomycetemcomitans]QEH49438.1 hypothetical protein FXN57_07220 [Aggregatibacter actinomycetemcomitans]TYA48424.1 hypothetical protein FXB74_10050 [Aggregatibacter actinomycetemcomitans]TYA50556.1 hypothetical protein FXB81_08870 [Aggregatibacter actinomycetemcomitans]TYB28468.1 hypothetical protein FXB78_08815 [Aggregatibacter actinomycetemcomitans]
MALPNPAVAPVTNAILVIIISPYLVGILCDENSCGKITALLLECETYYSTSTEKYRSFIKKLEGGERKVR